VDERCAHISEREDRKKNVQKSRRREKRTEAGARELAAPSKMTLLVEKHGTRYKPKGGCLQEGKVRKERV